MLLKASAHLAQNKHLPVNSSTASVPAMAPTKASEFKAPPPQLPQAKGF